MFVRENNPYGYKEMIAKFEEARTRGYWSPKSNSAREWLGRGAGRQ
jgi:cobaltochelatase CobN